MENSQKYSNIQVCSCAKVCLVAVYQSVNSFIGGQEDSFVSTDCDEAVRLNLVDPEAVFHHAARLVQQLFELAQREGSYLRDQRETSGSNRSMENSSCPS